MYKNDYPTQSVGLGFCFSFFVLFFFSHLEHFVFRFYGIQISSFTFTFSSLSALLQQLEMNIRVRNRT